MVKSLLCDLETALKRHHLLLAFIVLVIAALVVRAFFGVDLTDESYYFTQVLRLLQGDRLFADIWDVTQTQGVVLLPFYWLYTTLFGYDGLLLFGRLLMLALNLITALFLYYALSFRFSKRSAALISLITVAFAPFSLLTVSYNNLQQTFMLLGVSLGYIALFRAASKASARWLLFTGGFVHALMVASYPAAVVSLPFLLGLLLFGARKTEKDWKAAFRRLIPYASGLAVVAIGLVAYVLLFVGLRDALYGVSQMFASPGMAYPEVGLWDKIDDALNLMWENMGKRGPILYMLLVGMASYLILRRPIAFLEDRIGETRLSFALTATICLCIAALIIFSFYPSERDFILLWVAFAAAAIGFRKNAFLALNLGIAAWIILCTRSDAYFGSSKILPRYASALTLLVPLQLIAQPPHQRKLAWHGAALLLIPSLLITSTIASFSSGFFSNAQHGLFGAVLFLLLMNAAALEAYARAVPDRTRNQVFAKLLRRIATSVVPIVVAIAMVCMYYSYVYRDSPVRTLDTTVSHGPARGIRTREPTARYLDQMALDLRAQSVPNGKLLVLENCPYAYGICEDMAPFATSTWVASMYSRGGYAWVTDTSWTGMFDYMEFRGDAPDVIFYYQPAVYANVSDPAYGLHVFMQENYTCVLKRDAYWIYRLNE